MNDNSRSAPAPHDVAALSAAAAICRDLTARAVPSDTGLTWQAEIMVGVDGDAPLLDRGDIGPTLYDGTAGVAVVLATLGAPLVDHLTAPQSREMEDAARGSARHALAGSEAMLRDGRLGFWDGACGIAHAAAVTARHLDDAALRRDAAALAAAVAAISDRAAPAHDLISGDAGTALGLTMLSTELRNPDLAAAARVLAERLTAAAQPRVWGSAWPSPTNPDELPLLGLGHGAAGVALALHEVALHEVAGLEHLPDSTTEHLVAASRAGLEYERSWFDPQQRGWPDLRSDLLDGAPSSWMSAWCHGAIGIGLSRLRLGALDPDPRLTAEASAALQAGRDLVVRAGTALHDGAPTDCSSCHGLSGTLELFTVAARRFDAPEHAAAARRVAALLLAEHELAGTWPCGLTGAGEIPGLMTGTAGIALALTRAVGATTAPTPLLPGISRW